jgi:hypothetical protein
MKCLNDHNEIEIEQCKQIGNERYARITRLINIEIASHISLRINIIPYQSSGILLHLLSNIRLKLRQSVDSIRHQNVLKEELLCSNYRSG